jgi:hypothetical protein
MATVRLTMDVEVTCLDQNQATVITTQALPSGERVLLEIPDSRGVALNTRLARTVKTRVISRDGQLRRELHLAIIGDTRVPDVPDPGDLALPTTRLFATVSRRVPVRLVEVSASGCLWDAAVPIDEGSVGFLEVRTRGQCKTEAVRVLRTQDGSGSSWPYRMAVEFLTLAPVSPDALHGVAAVVATGTPSPHEP